MGMCRMPHLSLRILQQSMHQLVGPMPEEEQHVSMKQVVTKDESKNEDEKKKESSTPLPQRSTNNNEEENDDPDEDEKIYFPRFVAWLCGDGEEEKEDQEENNTQGKVATSQNKKNKKNDNKNNNKNNHEIKGHKEVMQKGRLREIHFMITQRKQLLSNASRTRNMQREQMVFHRTQVREARLLELTIEKEADEEDRQARLDMELSMLQEEQRKASEGSMQASMSEGETPEERMKSAQQKAKRRWMNLRLRDAAESGYLEQATVRALTAMLDGEDLLGAIAAAKMEPKKEEKLFKGDEEEENKNAFQQQRPTSSNGSSSRPSSRGTSASGWGSSRPSSRGDGSSRPGSRQRNRSRPGSRSGSRPTTGKNRRNKKGSSSSAIDALYDHQTDESKIRHLKLIRHVEAMTGPLDDHGNGIKRDDMIIVPHVNYECPIPWNHVINGLNNWLRRMTINYMRNILYRTKEYRWHILETGRNALRLDMHDEKYGTSNPGSGQDGETNKKLNRKQTENMEEHELAESFFSETEQSMILRPLGYEEQGPLSLAGEDGIAKDRVWTFKIEVDAPGNNIKQKIPHYDPIDSDEEEDDLEFGFDEHGSPTKSDAGGYTARTDDSTATFATGMTGMTQFTVDSETSAPGGDALQPHSEEDEDDSEDEESEEDDDDDEVEMKLPEKPGKYFKATQEQCSCNYRKNVFFKV